MSQSLDEHRQYLTDPHRVEAFSRAIAEVVRPGQIVVDLGAGTGILALLACRTGAARVYCVESGGMIQIAREAARANGFGDRITFIRGLSTKIELPEKVDVVVADQIGSFGFDAGVLEYFKDARARFLKPHGVTIPCRLDLILAPVHAPEVFGRVESWREGPADLDFSFARVFAANAEYHTAFEPSAILGDAVVVHSLDLNQASTSPFRGEGSAEIRRAGVLQGLGAWFIAHLSPNVRMTNSPLASEKINRQQVYFPIEQAVSVQEGDIVRLSAIIHPSTGMINFSVQVLERGSSKNKGSFHYSTWKGLLLSQEDVERTRPGFVPRLTTRGEAQLAVSRLSDGTRTRAEIEQEIMGLYPRLFHDSSQAAAFVSEILARYSQ